MLRAARLAEVILAPCGFVDILVEILVRDVVVLALYRAAQAGEVALGLIGAGAVPRERLRMVDPVRLVAANVRDEAMFGGRG